MNKSLLPCFSSEMTIHSVTCMITIQVLYWVVVSAIVADQETARDVLQEVFVNIWRKIESYDPAKGRLFTWMMNVARNAAIDKIRSRGYQDSLKNQAIPDN